jgi:hypothetical protein
MTMDTYYGSGNTLSAAGGRISYPKQIFANTIKILFDFA